MTRSTISKGATPYTSGCKFAVWAPHADAVFVIGTFNDWCSDANPLAKNPDGTWWADVPGVKPGDEYRFRIVASGKEYSRIDPYARRVTSSVANGMIPEIPRHWKPSGFSPPPLNQTVIYEMHIGTFGKKTATPGPGNLEGAIERLEHLKELGANTVEIMPVAEFPGGFSWGYNPSLLFAVESDYGTPRTFREFVDEAHRLGIAVIVDVVYNHLGPGDLDLWQFDGWSENGKGGIYFYNDWRAQTPWGDTRPDYGRPEVREYLRDNALMWIRDYGVDGLRWDATAYIRNAHGHDNGTGSDLPDGWSLMQWINTEMRKAQTTAFSIAEDLRCNPFLTKAVKDNGAGFNAQWDGGFVHPVRAALCAADDAARNIDAVRDALLHRYYLDAFERVIYTESHDEVANGKARIPEEVDPGKASSWAARKKSALGAALVFTAPGIPMIFQGQEFLEDDWFHDQDPLDWSKKKRFAGIFRLYQDLIRLRLNRDGQTAGLCGQEISVYHVDGKSKVVGYHRWGRGGPGDSVLVVANFSTQPLRNYTIGFPAQGTWRVRLNTDSKAYDSDFTDMGYPSVDAAEPGQNELPCKGTIDVAPYSALVLSQDKQ
ncbi:MAG: alpha amylase C-terminal domain-containing protein [Pirellulales bacterium]|nr:alpha amylase C-terminal domain-containing protein [Pirellulales bacterium]